MTYGVALIVLGLAQIVVAHDSRWASWLLLWSGLCWIWAGCAYVFVGPRALGKRADGCLEWGGLALLFPFLAVTWLLWHLQRLLSREAPCVEVAPGLWLGRRCSVQELPHGIHLVIDLTAEFGEPREVRLGRAYRCVPTLDASAPRAEDFEELIRTIAGTEEPIYIHCALGHGRSATVAIAALVARGAATTSSDTSRPRRWTR